MPADISIRVNVHETNGYRLVLIGDPLQSHVVAWEQAARKLKNEDAKPLLHKIMVALNSVNVTEGDLSAVVMSTFKVISDALRDAIRILEANETLTLSANHGVYVKAALMAGWVEYLETIPEKPDEAPVRLMQTVDDVNNMKPWLVTWIAERIGMLYMEVTTIPKN